MTHRIMIGFSIATLLLTVTLALVQQSAVRAAEEKAAASAPAAPAGGIGGREGVNKLPEGAIEQIIAGGWVSWTLLLISIICLGMCIELYVITNRDQVIPSDVVSEIQNALDQGDSNAAMEICQSEKAPVAQVIGVGLAKVAQGPERMGMVMTEEIITQMTGFNTKLGYISLQASLAPTMGLLGTVLGMIESFGVIAKSTTTNPQDLAGGIFIALVCTTMGLVVNIPGTCLFVFLRFRLERLKAEMTTIGDEIIDRFHGQAEE